MLGINAAGFATGHVFSEAEVAALNDAFETGLESHAAHLDARERDGKVRRCHGDLHLRNICLIGGEPVIFDCIEFNDQLATTDVLYDLAFLLMDLWHRDLRGLANMVANRYFDEAGDEESFALLPFLMAIRAAVRAHVTGTQCEDDVDDRDDLVRSARSYFDLARDLLQEKAPAVFALGGLSGSGKTTVAEALAPHAGSPPGARLLESDRIRKALFGKPGEERLGGDAYARDVSDNVYRLLGERSARVAAAGGTVVANAVFSDPSRASPVRDRNLFCRCTFHRYLARRATRYASPAVANRKPSASDATVDVLERQLDSETGRIGWSVVNSDRPADKIAREIIELEAGTN